MKSVLFVDTSAWFAFGNRSDPQHKAVSILLKGSPGRLVTSNYVLDETLTLCLRRAGHRAACQVGAVLRDPQVVELLRVTADDEQRAWELFRARPDKLYSFTDCTSFVLLRKLGTAQVVSLDDDFRQEGFDVLPR